MTAVPSIDPARRCRVRLAPIGPPKRSQRCPGSPRSGYWRRQDRLGKKYLDLQVQFDPGLSTDSLATAIDEVYAIVGHTEVPLTRQVPGFDDRLDYSADADLLDPHSGVLEVVADLDTCSLGPSDFKENSEIASSYHVSAVGQASNLAEFRDEVDIMLALHAKGRKSAGRRWLGPADLGIWITPS